MDTNKNYSISTEEFELLGYFTNIVGLSGGDKITVNGEKYDELTLEGCIPHGRLKEWVSERQSWKPKNAENVDINILDYQNKTIGKYFVSTVFPIDWSVHESEKDEVNVKLAGHVNNQSYPYALAIWKVFQKGFPKVNNKWATLSADKRKAWLEVVRLYSCERRNSLSSCMDSPVDSIFNIDGTHIEDGTSFFCAIGEAINGPGGYFGSGLDSLDDCLCGGFGATVPFTLKWNQSYNKIKSLVEGEIFNILSEKKVKIISTEDA